MFWTVVALLVFVFAAGIVTGAQVQKSFHADTWKEELAKEDGWNKGWEAAERTCLEVR